MDYVVDFKTGMRVVDRQGCVGMVLLGTKDGDGIFWYRGVHGCSLNLFEDFNTYYNKDLRYIDTDLNSDDEEDIVCVYEEDEDAYMDTEINKEVLEKLYSLVWSREEGEEGEIKIIEMTFEEVEEALGHKVKIVSKKAREEFEKYS